MFLNHIIQCSAYGKGVNKCQCFLQIKEERKKGKERERKKGGSFVVQKERANRYHFRYVYATSAKYSFRVLSHNFPFSLASAAQPQSPVEIILEKKGRAAFQTRLPTCRLHLPVGGFQRICAHIFPLVFLSSKSTLSMQPNSHFTLPNSDILESQAF